MRIVKKQRVGLNILDLIKDEPRVFTILELGAKASKKYKTDIPFFAVLDVQTGEEGMIWIDGGIKGAFGGAQNLGNQVGKTFEFTHKGLKSLGDSGQEVNSYDIFEVDIEE